MEQCELDDEKLMGKSSRQRGPKVGEREIGRHKLREIWENRGHMPRGTQESVQRRVSESKKEKERGGRQVGRCLQLTPTEST